MKFSTTLLLTGLAAQQVSATWNRGARHFNSPKYNNNECSDKQKEGFNWGDLPEGNFNNYGDFNFGGGWKCSNSFGKRDALTKRTFGSKCIKNKVKKETPAKFDCDKRKDGFSIKEIQVSVEFDCDLEFHYTMPDKSICKHVKSCSKDGTLVQNTQCGGARSVEVYLGNHNQGGRNDCEIGFHHIDFDCNPGYTPPSKPSYPVSTPSQPAETPSQPAETPSQPAETPSQPAETPSQPAETPSQPAETPSNTPPPVPSSVYPTGPIFGNSSTSAVPPPSNPETSSYPVEGPSSTAPVEVPSSSYPVEGPSSTAPVEVPSSSYPVEGPSSTAPVEVTSSSYPVENPASSTPAPQPTPPTYEGPGYTPPEVLPQCMNTWLEINSECKDNTDSDCYCKNPDFTKNVIECVAAWATDDKTQEALQYLIGICANHVPENPGLITDCPSNIPINPTGSTPSAPVPSAPVPVPSGEVTPPPAVPVTTITYQTTVTVPCSTVPEGTTVSTISTTVTVPQVVFTTQTPTQPPAPGVTPTEEPVVLIPGTPAPVPAVTTGAPYPIPSGAQSSFGTVKVPVGTGTAAVPQPAEFTGAASPVSIPLPALLGAALAFFAL